MIEYWIIGSVLVLYWIVMIPIQYRNIGATKKEREKSRLTHNEINEQESFETQQLKFNLQGSPFNLPATIIAEIIYFFVHLGDKKEG